MTVYLVRRLIQALFVVLAMSLIVFVAILVMTAFIFVVDLGFNEVIDFLIPSPSSMSTVLSAVLPLL